MAAKEKNKGLIALIIVGLLLVVLGLKKPAGGTGGAALPGGAIGSVNVSSQQYLQYAARAHLIPKSVGSPVNVTVTWTAATKNSLGQPINWNYLIDVRWHHPATGQLRTSAAFPDGFLIGSLSNGTYTHGADPTLVDAAMEKGNWDVQVQLRGDTSSPTGTPNGDAEVLGVQLAFMEHKNAFQVI